uniref:Uncharacterized protein n=1 Tax=Arundo donax TaxID=35708 RepID=A0A0A8YFX4_ARUDO
MGTTALAFRPASELTPAMERRGGTSSPEPRCPQPPRLSVDGHCPRRRTGPRPGASRSARMPLWLPSRQVRIGVLRREMRRTAEG